MFETITIAPLKGKVKIRTAVLESFDAAVPSPKHVESAPHMQHAETIKPLPIIDEEAIREAFNSGMEEGSRRTKELLERQYSLRLEEQQMRVEQLMNRIQQKLQSLSPEIEQALFRFAVGIAEHIIRKEAQIHPEIVLSVIKDSLKKIVGVEKITIRIAPEEMEYLQGKKAVLQSISDSVREITFEADDSIEAGGCIVESDIGNVDARIATQLEQVKEILFKQS